MKKKELIQKELEEKISKKNFRIADNIYVKSDEYDNICNLNQLMERLARECQTSDEKKIHGKRETASELLRFFSFIHPNLLFISLRLHFFFG